MKKINKLFAIPPTILLLLGLTTLPVLARNGSDDNNTTQSTTTSASQPETHETPDTNDGVNREPSEGVKHDVENETETESKHIIGEFKKTDKEHSKEDRKKNCDAAEHGLETKLRNLSKHATAFQAKIDGVLASAVTYQTDNKVNIDGFDNLLATAKTAKTQSALSLSALSSLNVNLDCSQPGVAQNVAEFKVAAKKARTDLKAYKDAVKAILKAIETAKEVN